MKSALSACRALGAMLVIHCAGCSGIEKAKPTPAPARASAFTIDVPQIMRGTIASETILLGYEVPGSSIAKPIVVRGYGLVVGLNGTGSREVNPQVAAYMLAEATKGGFGSEWSGPKYSSISPRELIDSLDTAIVIVEAVIPQGAVKGARFDVRVFADPTTGTTSLEGGRLYSTKLRPGPLAAGGAQAFELAIARGPVFVNPFAEPGALQRDTVVRTAGRILNGGEVVKDMPMKLRLANPSHARASILQSAINARFPQEPGQRDPTARGESEEVIAITVPPSWALHTEEFVELLRHTTISQVNAEAVAMAVRRTLLANPILADAAALRWEALGKRVLPLIKDLYDYPEELPRLAALAAGARLDDPLGVPYLCQMARDGSSANRQRAIKLLARMRLNPQIDLALRGLLDDDDVEVRLEAYEALVQRRDPALRRVNVDGKFALDIVTSRKPLIYITQAGEPRIVLFGPELAVSPPVTMRAWSNRLMLKGDPENPFLEVYYRRAEAEQGVILRSDLALAKLVQVLGHTPTVERPAPGLGLSYGETVGALHQMWLQKCYAADFRAEQDRILAAILREEHQAVSDDRPEFAAPKQQADTGVKPADPRETSDLGRLDEAPSVPRLPRAPGGS